MLIEILCQRSWAMKQLVQTGLFLSEKDSVMPNPAWLENYSSSAQTLILEIFYTKVSCLFHQC